MQTNVWLWPITGLGPASDVCVGIAVLKTYSEGCTISQNLGAIPFALVRVSVVKITCCVYRRLPMSPLWHGSLPFDSHGRLDFVPVQSVHALSSLMLGGPFCSAQQKSMQLTTSGLKASPTSAPAFAPASNIDTLVATAWRICNIKS